MPTGECSFKGIAMDFVGEIPESEGFNIILVVTDQFTKVHHYNPAKTTSTTEEVADSDINDVWKLHGLPGYIASDGGLQFALEFLQALNRKLNINLPLSTTYNTQTDGLSEGAVQTLKQYLPIYCYDRQNRWRAWLSLAEFAYYTTATLTHKLCLYRSLYGFHPRAMHHDNDCELCSPTAEEWLYRMTTVYNHILDILKRINNKRSNLHIDKARNSNIDDWIMVERRNL